MREWRPMVTKSRGGEGSDYCKGNLWGVLERVSRLHRNLYTWQHTFVKSHQYIHWISLHVRRFPGGASGKEPACQCRRCKRHAFIPWVRKVPWRRKWQPTPGFLLENPMDRGAWQVTVHGVAKSWTRLKQFSTHALHVNYTAIKLMKKKKKILQRFS